jgi:hypothetical protein
MFPSAFNSKRFGCYKSQPPLHTIACPWETGYDALKQKSPKALIKSQPHQCIVFEDNQKQDIHSYT